MAHPIEPSRLASTSVSPRDSWTSEHEVPAGLAGPSAAISLVLGQLRRVAPYYRTAMITGERDCGEQDVARFLHQLSPLHHRPFLELKASEADDVFAKPDGYELVASKGMLYLPQPEAVAPFAQALLVRILRERGPQAPRIVAFAERGLRSLVSVGTVSAELAESLGALRIVLPALRERAEDIPELFSRLLLLEAAKQSLPSPVLAPDLLAATRLMPWLGNLEQLRTVACALLGRGATLPLTDLDLKAVLNAQPDPPRRDRREIRMVTLHCVLQEHLRAVLFACNGNKLRAAEVLGISRSTLYRMLDFQEPSEVIGAGDSASGSIFAHARITP